jgi:hypothetical protein
MAVGSLKALYTGFAAFERQLLQMEHTGWVHYKPRTEELILYKSPYRATPLDDHRAYIAPADLRPKENELVTFEVEGPIRELKGRIKDSCYFSHKDWYKVVGVTRPNLNEIAVAQKPYLDANEFLYRLSWNWKHAAEDHLDFSLALQILSCPEGPYGRGGIGTRSLAGIGTTRSPLIDLKRTISHLLPTEFLNGVNRYRYNFIENTKAQHKVEEARIKSDIPEISYNHIWQLPRSSLVTSIQIPTLIYNSEYIPKTLGMDQDVLEYLLTALMVKPPVEDYMISKIEDTTKKVYKRISQEEAFQKLNLDPLSPTKVANAICRLDLRNKLDEDAFDSYSSKFDEIMYAFLEAEKDIVDTNPDRQTWMVPSNVRVSYQANKLEPIDRMILHIMRKIEEEQGKEWVTCKEIEQHPDFNPKWRGDWRVNDSLKRLNISAKILKSPRGIGYKRLKFD